MKIGQSIKSIRVDRLRQSQKEFCAGIGLSQTYLSQVEHGLKSPSTDVLQNISDYVKVPLPVLFWYGIEEKDVSPDKKDYFKVLKPAIDELMFCLFGKP